MNHLCSLEIIIDQQDIYDKQPCTQTLKACIQQSRLKDLNGTRRVITCPNCMAENEGTILANYLGTDIIHDVYKNKNIVGPDIILIICSICNMKSVFCNGFPYTFVDLKEGADELQNDITSAYNEAVKCLSDDSYTATTMMCRKILMLVAMDLNADKNKKFEYYIDYLEENGYITQSIKNRMNYIRNIGNDANHKKEPINDKDAMNAFMFVTALLYRVHKREYLSDEYLDAFCGVDRS